MRECKNRSYLGRSYGKLGKPTVELKVGAGNTKGGSITVPLTSCLTGLELAVQQQTNFVFIFKTD